MTDSTTTNAGSNNAVVSSTRQTPASSPTMDLRHMTSTSGLAATSPTTREGFGRSGRRTSQHLRATDARVGSPNSIPSSPTSVHSSSSAIFERDIEPLLPPSPSTSTRALLHDPHRIPRARTTEHLEQSVPSVLDSAAAVLLSPDADPSSPTTTTTTHQSPSDTVSVLAPAASHPLWGSSSARSISGSGFASPLSLRSRSPSPLGTRSPRPESLLLLNLTDAHQPTSLGVGGHAAVPMGRSVSSSSTTNATHTSPVTSPMSLSPSHPPSPPPPPQNQNQNQAQKHLLAKRLSFMSYTDLLTSTPASTHTLTSLTSAATSEVPPPHIPSVSGLNLVSASAASILLGGTTTTSPNASLRGYPVSSNAKGVMCEASHGVGEEEEGEDAAAAGAAKENSARGRTTGVGLRVVDSTPSTAAAAAAGKRDSAAAVVRVGVDSVGGEFEREGFGGSLEARLDG